VTTAKAIFGVFSGSKPVLTRMNAEFSPRTDGPGDERATPSTAGTSRARVHRSEPL